MTYRDVYKRQAIYLLPNKITISQIISLVFTVAFFASPSQKLEGLTAPQFFRIIAYQTILLTYCNINYCWTETTKRKAFLANRELLDLSSKDPLTGAYNRKKFDDALDEWLHLSLIHISRCPFLGLKREHVVKPNSSARLWHFCDHGWSLMPVFPDRLSTRRFVCSPSCSPVIALAMGACTG